MPAIRLIVLYVCTVHGNCSVDSSEQRPVGTRAKLCHGVAHNILKVNTDHRRGQLKCDGTRAENRFRLSAKRTSPFKSAGASVQSTTGSRGVRISGSNAGYTMFRGSVKSTGYSLRSPVSPSLPLPCVTVCRHISLESTNQLYSWHRGRS